LDDLQTFVKDSIAKEKIEEQKQAAAGEEKKQSTKGQKKSEGISRFYQEFTEMYQINVYQLGRSLLAQQGDTPAVKEQAARDLLVDWT
jgi:hypothetical protein